MYASHRAARRALLFGHELPADVIYRILFEGLCRVAALLGAVVYEPVLAHVEVTPARAATSWMVTALFERTDRLWTRCFMLRCRMV